MPVWLAARAWSGEVGVSYSICRLARFSYEPMFDNFYRERPDLLEAPSAVQLSELFKRGIMYSNAFSRVMSGLGNDAHEIICDAESIQKTWAAENGVTYGEKTWYQDIVYAQLDRLRPEVVYIQGVSPDHRGVLPRRDFKERFPFVKVVVGYQGFIHEPDIHDGIDVLLTGAPFLYDYFKKFGIVSDIVYHSFDETILDRVGDIDGERDIAASFCGASGIGFDSGHKSRYWHLLELILRGDIEAWVYDRLEQLLYDVPMEETRELAANFAAALERVAPERAVAELRSLFETQFGNTDPVIPLIYLIPDRVRPPVFGSEMFDIFRRSRTVFNRHTDKNQDNVGNVRMFEATGLKACLLTDSGINIRDLFEPDAEVVCYSGLDEAKEKLAYLAENPDAARDIAEAGHRRVMRSHAAGVRFVEVDDIIKRALRRA